MTKQKTFKRRVRERMEKTGESYTSARAALIAAEPDGVLSETSALRFALAEAGTEISEALALLIAGGAGAACMSFHYEQEDFSHFHLSGWNPFQSDIRAAVTRLGLTPDVHETTGAKTADAKLRERLEHAVQIAWVEDYRVLVVLSLDGDTARVYDRTTRTISTEELAARRATIRKERHRLLAIAPGEADVASAVRAGLIACANGPLNPPSPGMSLAGLARWADQLDAGWPKFPPGKHRDGALASLAAATRDGLLRDLQADGLEQAAELLGEPALRDVARRTRTLAAGWKELAAHRDLDALATRVRALHEQEAETVETLKALLT